MRGIWTCMWKNKVPCPCKSMRKNRLFLASPETHICCQILETDFIETVSVTTENVTFRFSPVFKVSICNLDYQYGSCVPTGRERKKVEHSLYWRTDWEEQPYTCPILSQFIRKLLKASCQYLKKAIHVMNKIWFNGRELATVLI